MSNTLRWIKKVTTEEERSCPQLKFIFANSLLSFDGEIKSYSRNIMDLSDLNFLKGIYFSTNDYGIRDEVKAMINIIEDGGTIEWWIGE